jgi:hypothetical protein
MRSFVILTAAFLLSLAGCVSMPDPVPNNFLVEKTPEQGKILEKLENGIIAKNHEVKALRDKSQAALQTVVIEKGRLDILKDERKLLDEKQKQFQLENDPAKIEDNNKQIAAKDSDINTQQLKLERATASSELARAQKEMGESELSVMVAELGYEKARIAREYLVKHQTDSASAEEKDQSSPDKYDDQYRLYLEKQRENLVEKRNARDEAALKLKIAEDKLKQ